MLPSSESPRGTSFHGHTITTNLFNIRQGIPNLIDYEGDGGNVNYYFIFKMDNGEVITLYDWRKRPITDLQIIDWHIGGHSAESTARAKRILESLITSIISL